MIRSDKVIAKIIEMKGDITLEDKDPMQARTETIKESLKNRPKLALPTDQDLPKGFFLIEGDLRFEVTLNIETYNSSIDTVSVKDITYLVLRRHVADMLAPIPNVLKESYWVVHAGRYVCGFAKPEIWEALVNMNLKGVQVEYAYIDLDANRFTYHMKTPTWPTQGELKAQLENFNKLFRQTKPGTGREIKREEQPDHEQPTATE